MRSGRRLRVEADGSAIAIHDYPRALRREAGLQFISFIFALMMSLGAGWVALVTEQETRPDHFQAFLFGAICISVGVCALLPLFRTARLIYRLGDSASDLLLTPQGLQDRWLRPGRFAWSHIRFAETAIHQYGLRIRLQLAPSWSGSVPDTVWMRFGNADSVMLAPCYGLNDLPLLFDTLYALADFVPVTGLPPGYRTADVPFIPKPQNRVHVPPLTPPATISETAVMVGHGRRFRMLALGVFSILFFVLWVALYTLVGGQKVFPLHTSMYWISWVFGPGSLIGGVWFLGMVMAPRTLLEMDRHGVRLTRFPGFGTIPWTAITAWRFIPGGDKRLSKFEFAVHDLAVREARLPWFRRWRYRLRRRGSSVLRVRAMSVRNFTVILQAARVWHHNAWDASARFWLAGWRVRGRDPDT